MSSDLTPDEIQVQQALNWVHPTPGIVELRPEDRDGKRWSGFYTDRTRLCEDAAGFDERATQWTINRIDGRLLPKATNTVAPAERKGCTQGRDIVRITSILIDCDAIKPKGWPSTEDEHSATREAAVTVRNYLTEKGFPLPAEFDSGNGSYLMYATDLDPEMKPLVKAFLEHISRTFSNPKVCIDESVYKLPQLARVPGSMNRKKNESPDRPYRKASVIVIPAERALVTAAMLSSVVPPESAPADFEPADFEPGKPREVLATYQAWLKARKVRYTVDPQPDGATLLRFAFCPFKSKVQDDGRAWLLVSQSGYVAAGCWHDHCLGKGLEDLHARYKWQEWLEDQDLKATGVQERVTNPHRQAREYLQETAIGGQPTYIHYDESLYGWCNGLYSKVTDKALLPDLTASIKGQFDAHARKLKGIVQPVKRSHVADCLAALKSLARLPAQSNPPCWLTEREWLAEDCIPFGNGILHAPSFLAGSDTARYFIPATPAFFNTHGLAFAYDPRAPKPTRWLQFLDQLWDDTACHNLAHEWGGYCMTRDTSRQKYLTLLGVTRSGKGTYCHVLGDMVGGNFGAPTFRGILGKNGYESLRGKQLAIFPDCKAVPKNILAEFCGLLCAITGEDTVTIDAKYERLVTEQLCLKVVVQVNEIFALPDNSNALASRQLFLRFVHSFAGKEDTTLKAQLALEYSGIANLFLDGLRRLHKDGWTEPESSRDLRRLIGQEASPLRTFQEECCLLHPSAAIMKEELLEAYRTWAEDNDHEPLKQPWFGRELLGIYPQITRSQNVGACRLAPRRFYLPTLEDEKLPSKRPYYYVGIRLS